MKLELLRSDGVCAAINCQTIEKAPEWGFFTTLLQFTFGNIPLFSITVMSVSCPS